MQILTIWDVLLRDVQEGLLLQAGVPDGGRTAGCEEGSRLRATHEEVGAMGRRSWTCPGGGGYGQVLGTSRETFEDCNSDLALLFLAHFEHCAEKESD